MVWIINSLIAVETRQNVQSVQVKNAFFHLSPPPKICAYHKIDGTRPKTENPYSRVMRIWCLFYDVVGDFNEMTKSEWRDLSFHLWKNEAKLNQAYITQQFINKLFRFLNLCATRSFNFIFLVLFKYRTLI